MYLGPLKQRRDYKKRVSAWTATFDGALNISFSPPTVNGLAFGSALDDARCFGPPEDVTVLDRDAVSLDFLQFGLVLEYEKDRLIYVGVLLSPADDVPPRPEATPARAEVTGPGTIALSRDTSIEDMVRVLGNPVEDDMDVEDDERILTHNLDGCMVESEFTMAGVLKRFNLFPEA